MTALVQILVFVLMAILTCLSIPMRQVNDGWYMQWLTWSAPYLGVLAILLYALLVVLQRRESKRRAHELNRQTEELTVIRTIVSRQVADDASASIEQVFPYLRYANELENYAGSTAKAGNENRVLLESSPPVRLHLDRYSKDHPAFFDFGVANLNKRAPIDNVMFNVTFLGEGPIVIPAGGWATNIVNEAFNFHFQSINAQAGLNGDGALNVVFPRPGKYTIRLDINARGLGQKTQELAVIVE